MIILLLKHGQQNFFFMHEKIHKKIKNILGVAVSLHLKQEKIKSTAHKDISSSLLSIVKIIVKSDDVDVIAFGLIDFQSKNNPVSSEHLLLDLVSKDGHSPAWEERKKYHIDNLKTDLVRKVIPITNHLNLNNVEILADCFKRAVEPIFIKTDKKVIPVRDGWRWLPSKLVKTHWYHEGVTKIVHEEDDIVFVMLSTMVLTPKNNPLTKIIKQRRSLPTTKYLLR